MFVETAFKGDKNNKLKKLQNDVYKKQLRIWYDKSRFKYINAAILLNIRTDLFRIIVDKRYFDYSTLQEAYDLIAAYFRYENPKSNQLKLRF